MIILNIIDLMVRSANKNDLSRSDCITIALAFFTLLISFFSLCVACRTLKSQRKTEENTRPIINLVSQKELIKQFFREVFMSYGYLLSLQYQLIKTNYSVFPSSQFWTKFPDPKDFLYESLFYSNELDNKDDSDKFMYFKKFCKACNGYSVMVSNLKNEIKIGSETIIINEFSQVYQALFKMIGTLTDCLKYSFKMDMKEISEFGNIINPGSVIQYRIPHIFKDQFNQDMFIENINKTIGKYLDDLSMYCHLGGKNSVIFNGHTGGFSFKEDQIKKGLINLIYLNLIYSCYKNDSFIKVIKEIELVEAPQFYDTWFYYLYDIQSS